MYIFMNELTENMMQHFASIPCDASPTGTLQLEDGTAALEAHSAGSGRGSPVSLRAPPGDQEAVRLLTTRVTQVLTPQRSGLQRPRLRRSPHLIWGKGSREQAGNLIRVGELHMPFIHTER